MEQIQNWIDEQKLFKINKGHNFYNLKQTEKKYLIGVVLETEMDLLNKEEIIKVLTDLPIKSSDWRYEREFDVVDFLKELKSFVMKPLVKVRTANRKNRISSWELGDIKENFIDRVLKFSDINFSIGELAKKKLKYNFEERIKEILALQKKAIDKKIQKQVDNFIHLKEKMLVLETFIGKNKSEYSSYDYDKPKDKSIKISLTALEYNEKLKEIEIEIKKIANKLSIENIGYFNYLKIQKKISFKEWLEINGDELRENFENYDDGSEYENFEGYAKSLYDENGGFIEEEWKG